MNQQLIDEEHEPFLRSTAEQPNTDEVLKRPTAWQLAVAFKNFLVNNPILLGTFCLQFLNYIAKHMTEVPMIKLFEQAICNRYYENIEKITPFVGPNVDERHCKIPPIQDELAGLTGLKFAFDALPGLLTALYYGSIADRLGRRLVLALCCVGNICALLWILFVCYSDLGLPVKLVWASSAFLCIGGSQRVAKGMNFTVVADSTEISHRTRYMYILAGIPHVTTLIAPPVSGALMRIRTWVPFVVAVSAYLLGLTVLALMPESLNHDAMPKSPLLGPADTVVDPEVDEVAPSRPEQLPQSIHDRLPGPSPQRKEWWRDLVTLLHMPGLPFCYFLYFSKPVAMIAKAFVYQYASYNFHWGLSTTTWLRFSQAGGSTIATIVVLPLLHSVLNRRGLQAQRLDLNVIRISLFVAMIGFILLQFSFHGWMLLSALFVCGLSEGEEPALQGLTTSLIDRAYHARLFTSLTVVEILAKLVGGPLMGKLFAIGKTDGQGSKGVCFSVSAIILFILFMIALLQKPKR
ncbi:MAG: hypothetical protein Q9217_001470 [Psora testacea]